MQDIAESAGILSGSLYYYIDSKEDLLFALTERVHAEGLAYLDDPEIREGEPVARLRRFIDRWGLRLEQDLEWSLLVEREFRTLSAARLARVTEQRSAYEALLRSIIEQGQAEGQFDAATDSGVATQSIFQSLNYIALWYRRDGALSFQEIVAWQREFIVRGLSPAAPAAKSGVRG